MDVNDFLGEQPWWTLDADDPGPFAQRLAQVLFETVRDIERRQYGIFAGNRRHARLYAGYLPNALSWGSSPVSNQRLPFEATKGLVRSICDTATALIVRSRPKASIVTDGADWKVQQNAEDLDRFLVGAYERSGIYQVAPRSFFDSTVFGTGVWKYVTRGKGSDFHVCVERVLPDDLVVDEDECREHLEPHNVYHRTVVRTSALIRRYAKNDPAMAAKIRATANNQTWPTRHVPVNHSVLIEAHHVDPDDPAMNRRVLSVDTVVLEDEPWDFDFVPYTFLWWAPPISGFYGDGIAYRQYGRQQRITYLMHWIQRCHDLFATPRAWVDPAGGPPTMQLSNEIGAVIMARRPPTIEPPRGIVPPEIYRWLDDLDKGGFDDEGISQVTAQNRLPPGLESAPAQREYSYKEGQRFAPVSQRWEYAVAVDPAKKMTAFYRAHAARGTASKVKWADRKLVEMIEFPDLDVDAYQIRAEASNFDSLSPAARTQAALELAQTGWISPTEGRALLRHPDLKENSDLDTAGETYAAYILRKMYHGEDVVLDELADLDALDRVIRRGRLLAIQRNAPTRIVDNMARFLEELDIKKASLQPMNAGPSPSMAPSATPGGPPSVPFQG